MKFPKLFKSNKLDLIKLSLKYKGRWLFIFIKGIFIPLLFGVIVGLSITLPAEDWNFHKLDNLDIALTIFSALIISLLTELYKINHFQTSQLIEGLVLAQKTKVEIQKQFELIKVFSSLSPEKIKTYWELIYNVERKITNNLPANLEKGGGGYVLHNVGDNQYLSYISIASRMANNSYKSTLTGKYLPSWFFKDGIIIERSHQLMHLKKINDLAKDLRIRVIRLMIFNRSELQNDFGKLPNKEKDIFFDLQNHVELYFVDKSDLAKYITEDLSNKSLLDIVDYEYDYALIDDDIILLKNEEQARHLEILLGNHNKDFVSIFTVLENCLKNSNEIKIINNVNEIKKMAYEATTS